jgi:hypothetical protein
MTLGAVERCCESSILIAGWPGTRSYGAEGKVGTAMGLGLVKYQRGQSSPLGFPFMEWISNALITQKTMIKPLHSC